MRAREFCERHLQREARERILAECRARKATPHETASSLSKAHESTAPIDGTIASLRRSIAACDYVLEHRDEYPADVVEELGKRAAWKRELESLLHAEKKGAQR